MASLNHFAGALRAAAAASADSSHGDKQSFEELFSQSLRNALDRINGGSVDSYDLGPWVVSNLILLADVEGYELHETMDFLRVLLD